ncbi:MAG: bifunctional adenosylcobinamide kinase/adenosylcobinamide-phosphate guanylyltransferase [Polyangiaceae bacterium]
MTRRRSPTRERERLRTRKPFQASQGKLILVGGGARLGNSRFALALAESLGPRRTFVATAQALDGEMRTRIERHQRERELRAFRTVECPLAVPETVAVSGSAAILIDAVGRSAIPISSARSAWMMKSHSRRRARRGCRERNRSSDRGK